MIPDMYEHSMIRTNGIRLHVVTAGRPDLQPVILLHGFPEFWYGWRKQIPALARNGCFVIVPDQRGYNLSDKPRGVDRYRLEELTNDIAGVLDHFHLEKAAVIGHDWGAAVAWGLAIRQRERVERLGILNVPHPGVMWEFLHKSLKQMLKSWYIGFFQIPLLPDNFLSFNHCGPLVNMLRASGKPGTFTKEDIAEYRKAWSQAGAIHAMINWYRAAFRDRNRMAETHRVKIPTLILWGKKDVALREEMAIGSLAYCDHGQLVFFENSTHWVQHEETSAVNENLLQFLHDGRKSDKGFSVKNSEENYV